eukprot:jgi/Ulvmu1/11320/UM074_0035.1
MPRARARSENELRERVAIVVRPGEEMDVDELVDVLRDVYPEYRRQKRNPLARCVEEIMSSINQGAPTVPASSVDKESEPSTSEAPELPVTRRLNSSIVGMYQATTSQPADPQTEAAPQGDAAVADGPAQPTGAQAAVQGETAAANNAAPPAAQADAGTAPDVPGTADAEAATKSRGRATKRADLKRDTRALKRLREAGASAAGTAAPSTGSITAPKRIFYSDLGGIEDVLTDIRQLIEYPLMHPEVYAWLGVQPPRGVLLYGPPGCGKTALANAIANECGVPFLRIAAPEIVSGMSGESEAKLRQLFTDAAAAAPAILFIDEIDAIAPKRESAQREMERRIVAQMLTCMDDLLPAAPAAATATADSAAASAAAARHVVVIGATNRPDSLDAALRRAGRFDREISLGIPSEAARRQILGVLCRGLRLGGSVDVAVIAKATPGYVGADLSALAKEAAALAVARIFSELGPPAAAAGAAAKQAASGAVAAAAAADDAMGGATPSAPPPLSPQQLQGLAITMGDFEGALAKVQPSLRREGFTTKPDVSWDDVGSLEGVREELQFSITQPIRRPERFAALGVPAASGVLLFGPPGCGKTLVAKAVAADCGANFISIKGPELLNKYVGESERAVRQLFARARAARPCVVFFDELDALAPRRGSGDGNAAAERVVNQLLTELDGATSRDAVYAIAATNRPDIIDPALLRPGRLDKTLYVPLPDAAGRAAILAAAARRMPLAPDVDLAAVAAADSCTGFSGADLASLLREAAVAALKESLRQEQAGAAPAAAVAARHFQAALLRVRPSVSRADRTLYARLRDKLVASRSHIAPDTPPVAAAAADPVSAAGAGGDTAALAESEMETAAGGTGGVGTEDGGNEGGMIVDGVAGGAEPMEL